jgi:glycosyltransferase involved in cell wall biosynthesis
MNEHSNGLAATLDRVDVQRSPAAQPEGREPLQPRLSVIIGFRDWGLERLELALRAHRASSLADQLELVVVDYGSKDSVAVAAATERWKATLCRVETRRQWNRSHCLNVGIRAARAPRVLTTDADILFAPRAIERILEEAGATNDFLLVQCHDLPPSATEDLEALNFAHFSRMAELRPPWGMGGCACFRRRLAVDIRGFDERMEWWGAEDNDFVQRAMQHGENVRWFDHPDARCYHIWHPKATEVHAKNERFQATLKRNRHLVANDITAIRNSFPWGAAIPRRATLTASIVTCNRSHLIGQTIESLLVQSWSDFELLIVDDGSEDRTEEVVKSYADSRIRYVRSEHRGIPAARNLAVAEARGEYICIVDDDDVQLPDRLERHLSAVEEGYVGSYGGWIDFDEETGELAYNPGRPYSLEALLFASKVMLHPATCILRDVLLAHPYNPSLPVGSDFDCALRIAAAGYRLKHVGAYSILRRLHSGAVTNLHGASQRRNGERALLKLKAALTDDEASLARRTAARSKPLTLNNPLLEPSLALRLPPALARLLTSAARDLRTSPVLQSSAARWRLLDRRQHRSARVELGPFSSLKQAEVNLQRLNSQVDAILTIEARQQGATDQVYYIVWPWTTDGTAWDAADWNDQLFRYPSQLVVQEAAVDSRSSTNDAPTKSISSGDSASPRRSLEEVAGVFPPYAHVLVVSRGDESLLSLGDAHAEHFPQCEDGKYAGFHPADSADAIKRLEALKERGAQYLLIPASSFWWLEHYEDLNRYLNEQCQLIHFEDGVCLLYALEGKTENKPTGLTKPLTLRIGCAIKPPAAPADA